MKIRKKDKNIILLLGILFLVFLWLFFRKKTTKETNTGLFTCLPSPRIVNGGIETRPYAALYWNNPGGLIKTSVVWESFGEVVNPNNKTMYKAFKSYDDGIRANLYNLLVYLTKKHLRKVQDIVELWVGTSKGQQQYSYYINAIGFSDNCYIETMEQLKILFTNMMYAENTLNNTRYIYDNFHRFYNEVVTKVPSVKFF